MAAEAKSDLPKPDKDDDKYVDKLLALCKWSELTERYDDMCAYLKLLLDAKKGDLDDDERNLFSVGFKSVVGNLRRSWRSLNPDHDENSKKDFDGYKTYIQNQINSVCDTVVDLITNTILKKEEAKEGEAENDEEKRKCAEAQTFYHKMVGDYERYKAELLGPAVKSDKASKAYKKAMEIASPLPDTDSTKLGLALNYSVCLFEIAKNKNEAVRVAKDAFDNALKKLDELDDNDYKNSTLIMQLLRDNLTLWTSESDAPPPED